MSEEQDKAANAAEQMGLEDLSQIFAPSWARQTPDEVSQRANTRFAREEDGNDDRNGRRGGRSSRHVPRSEDRLPRRDGDSRPPRRDNDQRFPRRDNQNRPQRRDIFERRPAPPQPLALDIRFMPASKALASIIRRIQATHRAYPIRDIVKLFQNDDASLAVRIETIKDSDGPQQLFQCRLCGMPALSEEEVAEHLLKKHMTDYFDVEEIECDAPAGNFSCVAKCGLTGELLGPPNHHSYQHKVQEILRDRFPGMSEEEYRRHIEMVRDPEVVEQWREQSKKKRIFRRKAEEQPQDTEKTEATADENTAPEEKPQAPALERYEAEMMFRHEIMPLQIGAASHIVCPAVSLQNLPNRRLAAELSAKFADETNPNRRFQNRQPQQENAGQQHQQRNGSLFTAVHAAFHHRGLYFFRAGDDRGQEFVMASQPVSFDIEHATPELREIAQYVAANPSCPPKQLVDALNPRNDEEKTKRIVSQIKWLVEKGHLIEFFNGFLSPVASHPIFKPTPPKPKKEAAPEAPVVQASETAEQTGTENTAEKTSSNEDVTTVSNVEISKQEPEPTTSDSSETAAPTEEITANENA